MPHTVCKIAWEKLLQSKHFFSRYTNGSVEQLVLLCMYSLSTEIFNKEVYLETDLMAFGWVRMNENVILWKGSDLIFEVEWIFEQKTVKAGQKGANLGIYHDSIKGTLRPRPVL